MKRIVLLALCLSMVMFPVYAFCIPNPLKGDIDNSGYITLKDAIMVLQITSGMNTSTPVFTSAEASGDNKIGTAEAIYILQCISELRTEDGGGGAGSVCVWDNAQWDNCQWDQ